MRIKTRLSHDDLELACLGFAMRIYPDLSVKEIAKHIKAEADTMRLNGWCGRHD